MTDLRRLATRLAAYGLDPSAEPVLGSPLDEHEWREFLDLVLGQRLDGLLSAATAAGAFSTTGGQEGELDAHRRETAVTTLHLDRSTVGLVEVLAGAGIDYRILKGPAIAYLDYPDPALRPYIDVDMLIPTSQFDECVSLLSARGYTRKFSEPRPGFDSRFSKGAIFVSPAGHEVDLHRTFVFGPYAALVDPEALFERSAPLQMAGHEVRALGTEERFLHVCFHARLGDTPPRLLPMRDVAQILLRRSLDLERVEALCTAWQAESVVAGAITLAWRTLQVHDIVPLSAWAFSYRPNRLDERRLAAYRDVWNYPAMSTALAREIRSVPAKLAYLRALALPDQRSLDGRYSGHARRWWRGGKRLSLRFMGRNVDGGRLSGPGLLPASSAGSGDLAAEQ
jgi:hypothetical protein